MIYIYNEIKSEVKPQARVTRTIWGRKQINPYQILVAPRAGIGMAPRAGIGIQMITKANKKNKVGILIHNHKGFVSVNSLGISYSITQNK